MSFIETLKWRYATKKFDATKKISDADLETLKEAAGLTATSYGLQQFKVLIIENPELRAKLQPVSWGQTQIVDASHLFVICADKSVTAEDIDGYIKRKSDTQGIPLDSLAPMGDFMKSKILEMPDGFHEVWNGRQTYIVLGNLMSAAADLKIDTCPMEGFDPTAYDEILGLSAKGLSAVCVLPLGYRSAEDASQHAPKVRKPLNDLFEVI